MRIETDAALAQLLGRVKTIAVVGASPNPLRPSHYVMAYLLAQGYTVVPVNPGADSVLGVPCVASLLEVPIKIDLVDCFRRSEEMPALVEEIIAVGATTVWMQQGVIHAAAAARAEAAGIEVVMDRCIKIEHQRLIS